MAKRTVEGLSVTRLRALATARGVSGVDIEKTASVKLLRALLEHAGYERDVVALVADPLEELWALRSK